MNQIFQNNIISVNAFHNDNESNIPHDHDHNINCHHQISLAIITVFQTYLHYTNHISNKMRNHQNHNFNHNHNNTNKNHKSI